MSEPRGTASSVPVVTGRAYQVVMQVGDDGRLKPGAEPELLDDVRDMGFDGSFRDAQLPGQEAVRQSAPQEGQYLPLAIGQLAHRRFVLHRLVSEPTPAGRIPGFVRRAVAMVLQRILDRHVMATFPVLLQVAITL